VKGVGCTVTDNGYINISVEPLNPFYTYSWSDGQTTANISGLTEGTYEVTVTDDDGCTGVNQVVISQEPPAVNPICIVTVDDSTDKNLVVWEKIVTEDVLHYNIYRETSSKGDYQLIASVPVDELSQYVDSVADPSIRAWRYRLSAVDACGNESDLSDHHKTMHLAINFGPNRVNLNWDHYEGDFEIDQYKIKRYDAVTGLVPLEDVPSDLTSRSDFNPPLEDLTYYIEIDRPTACTATENKAATHNSSRSNRITRLKEDVGVIDYFSGNANMRIYPNPGPGIFYLEMDLGLMDNVFVKVFDVTGKLVLTQQYENIPNHLEARIDLNELPNGIYHVYVKSSKTLGNRILVKQ
jgi:hypothetical protein